MKNIALLLSFIIIFTGITAEGAGISKKKLRRVYKCNQVGVQKVKAHKGAEMKAASTTDKDSTLTPVIARHDHHRR